MSEIITKTESSFFKFDENLGLLFGYAIVSEVDGEPYYDTQGDYIPGDSMLKAAADFMKNSRAAGDMHEDTDAGQVVFCWPMTDEIAKAFDIQVKKTGLLIAVKPDDDEMLSKFASGEYTGFSIGGQRVVDEAVGA